MLNRLPISLAQLQAENNSQKLKNEIKQLMYSLYESKKACKRYHFFNRVLDEYICRP